MNMTYPCLEQQHGKLNLINRLYLILGNVICSCLKREKKPKGQTRKQLHRLLHVMVITYYKNTCNVANLKQKYGKM